MTATPWALRSYAGAAPRALLALAITSDDLTITGDDLAGYPTTGPFFVVLDRGTASEEKVEIQSRSGNIMTVASTAQRGVDGTSARSHASGTTTIEHCVTAVDVGEANVAAHNTVGKITTKGDLLAGTAANELGRVPAGADGRPLVAASGETAGVGFAQLGTAGLADGAVTNAKLATGGPRWRVGDVKMSARATPEAGWLLIDGTAVSRTTYADLFAEIGTTYGAGDGSTTFNLPDPDESVLNAFIKT